MNLVIDCFKLVKGSGKSIGIYNLAKSITAHLGERALAQDLAAHSVFVLGNAYNRKDFDVPGVTFVEMKGNPLSRLYCILWELFLVSGKARKYRADRILFPRGYRPVSCFLGRKLKDTIIIHDLIPFFYDRHYPGVFNRVENAYIMNRLKASIRGADRIITISEFSRKDILSHVPGCEDRITVINNGLNDVTAPPEALAEPQNAGGRVLAKQGEGRPGGNAGSGADGEDSGYIVAMTSSLPHKNPGGILTAYDTYCKYAGAPLPLLVIGIGDTRYYPDMEQNVADRVTCCPYFEDFGEMCRVVAGAKAYLFLSYMEGFGFPPLEAMQLGVPVVCSDRSSLPEVVGDAALLVDPDDFDAAAKALIQVTTREGLRKELIEKGYENIKRFSWESRTDLYWKELFR